jgi:predicted alpha/beta superfamily hydrolase
MPISRRQFITESLVVAGFATASPALFAGSKGAGSLGIAPAPYQPVRHDQFEVQATGLGRYTIDVSLPLAAADGSQKFPVILVTDGNLLFDLAQAIANGRAGALASPFEPHIVVGVGYPADEGAASFYARRNFDFHGEWDMQDELGQILHQIFNGMKQAEGKPELQMFAGGAPRFSEFLREELLPQLAEHYPIDLDARHTLIGDSSGGHYVLRDVYDDRSPFSRYVCISPGFASAEGSIQRLEAEYAAGHDDMEVDLFLCSGRIEIDQNAITGMIHFGSGITWVAEQFARRQYPSAQVHWEIMNHEDHGSIAPRGIAAGLRSVNRVRPGVHDMPDPMAG